MQEKGAASHMRSSTGATDRRTQPLQDPTTAGEL